MIRRTFFLLLASTALMASTPAQALTISVTNGNSSGLGSLAQAITLANGSPAHDQIEFNILSLGTVTIEGPFPAITQPLTIDGYTQGNAAVNNAATGTNAVIRVVLDGSKVPNSEAVVQIDADNTTIRGVAIADIGDSRFGVRIGAGVEGTVLSGCFLGVSDDGTTDRSFGTGIRNDGIDTVIGDGSSIAGRNLISGNDWVGIDERGVGTVISNNLIGTDRDADGHVPNGRGIVVSTAGADEILVGGNAVHAANLIAGNEEQGIDVQATVAGNVQIEKNSFRDNGGLAIDLASNGVTLNDENDADFGPNHQQNYPGLTFARINGSFMEVEGYLPGPPNMYLMEFYILTEPDPSGFGEGERLVAILSPTTSGPGFHFQYAIELDGAIVHPFHVTATAQNMSTQETSEFSNSLEVIPGGAKFTVVNSGNSGAGSLRAAVEAANLDPGPNTIVFAIPDPAQQIVLQSSLTITDEVIIDGFTQAGAHPNTVSVGSNAVLKVEVDGSGIPSGGTFVVNADRVILRGLAINNGHGIGVQYSTGDFGRIEGCHVGTNLAGTAADGNNSHGIFTGAETVGIAIGGSLPSQRNIVSGNGTHGMRVTGDDAVIMGNIVGADATGEAPIPNDFNGISIEGEDVVVGYDAISHSGQNIAAFNAQDGIAVSSVTRGVTILGNSVHDNGDLGIDLSVGDAPGVTPNDEDDEDDGANRLQNFPEITEVSATGGDTTVEGTLDVPSGASASEYSIRVYSSAECDQSGHGEGEFFKGAETVVLSDDDESFSVTVAKGLSAGHVVAITATDLATGDTSEFSACGSIDTSPPVCGDTSGDDNISAGDALTVLRRAVGTAACLNCVCDVDSSGSVTTTDALFVLRKSVGLSVNLNCPPCIVLPPI